MHQVHLWIGQVDGMKYENYFMDWPPEDEHGFMQNEFAKSQGELCLDFDFVEISFVDDYEDVRSFVDGHSYSDSYLDALVGRAEELGMREINVFVLANEDQFSNPQSVERADLRLVYLGVFDCDDS